MNKKISIIVFCLNVILIIGVGFFWFSKPKVAYIKIQKIYNEFELKKQLEGKSKEITNTRKLILDSLELQLKSMNTTLENERDKKLFEQKRIEFKIKSEEYLIKKKNFLEDNQRMNKDYEEQILKQLNQYIFDYGKKNNYDFVLGASGNGSMMYASDRYDVTDDILLYVNKRFSGEGK